MKAKPILFTGPLVEAILDGWKTETRRVVRSDLLELLAVHRWDEVEPGLWRSVDRHGVPCVELRSPYGREGGLLHVGETLVPLVYNGRKVASYERDGAFVLEGGELVDWRWKVRKLSSMYCPKAYRRIWLKVLEVRVERVQSITGRACLAEGLKDEPDGEILIDGPLHRQWEIAVRSRFAQLWDSINEKRGFPWSSDPWVWVVRFELASSTGRPG